MNCQSAVGYITLLLVAANCGCSSFNSVTGMITNPNKEAGKPPYLSSLQVRNMKARFGDFLPGER